MSDFGQSSSLQWLKLTQEKSSTLAGPDGRSDIEVVTTELKKHRTRKDAWICINGNINCGKNLFKC